MSESLTCNKCFTKFEPGSGFFPYKLGQTCSQCHEGTLDSTSQLSFCKAGTHCAAIPPAKFRWLLRMERGAEQRVLQVGWQCMFCGERVWEDVPEERGEKK